LGGVVKWPLTKRLPKGLSRFMLPFFQKEKEAFLFGKPLLFHGIYNFRE
jgi:hypothetical protein